MYLEYTSVSVSAKLKQIIATNGDELERSFEGYFPTRESYPARVRQHFTFRIEVADVTDEYLGETIEIQ